LGLPPLIVAGAYAGPVRASLLAYKERGRRDLGGVLSAALAGAAADLVRTAPRPLVLVPVPSVAAAARARGGQHVQRLADGAARTLRRRGIPARVAPILAVTADRPDTAGLSAIERGLAAVGKYGLRRGWSAALPRSGRVVIVDDLVTPATPWRPRPRPFAPRVSGSLAGLLSRARSEGSPGTRRATAGYHPCRSVRL
jgi:predicted amidophosphoribosyltransferase